VSELLDAPSQAIRINLKNLLQNTKKEARDSQDDLQWEIRLHQFILKQPNPDLAAESFLNARRVGGFLRSKRKAAEKLGWII
jgi:hypothetical protein